MRSITQTATNQKRKLELWVIKVIEGEKSSFICYVFYLISLLFRLGLFLKNIPYQLGWKNPIKFEIPVICIGNIKVGGTGKTPFVQMLYQDLQNFCKIGIVSKGYKGVGVSKRDVITPIDYKGKFVSAYYCGDEPAMLKKRFKLLEIFISKNRILAIEKAIQKKMEAIILDDGFQQKKTNKDFSVVMIDPKDPFGKGMYLPRGYLRDSPSELKKADLLCLHYEYMDSINLKQSFLDLKKYSSSKIIATQRIPYFIKGEIELHLKRLRGKKIGVFCGIGNPQRFIKTLENLGAEVVETLVTVDHGILDEKELNSFGVRCQGQGAEYLLCTEKDYIKIEKNNITTIPIGYLESRLEVIYGRRHYEELKQKILEMSKQRTSID